VSPLIFEDPMLREIFSEGSVFVEMESGEPALEILGLSEEDETMTVVVYGE
jgi:hypothetical protein